MIVLEPGDDVSLLDAHPLLDGQFNDGAHQLRSDDDFAVAGGGHVRVGLEDAPFGSEMSNVEWVEDAAQHIENAGGRIASANDVRAALDNTKLENQ